MTSLLDQALDHVRTTGDLPSSFRNCHVQGLHSLMLGRTANGGLIRMFVTTPDHRLGAPIAQDVPMPLAVHAHRYRLTLIPFLGSWTHLRFQPAGEDAPLALHECRYTSGVTGHGGLKPTGRLHGFSFQEEPMRPGLSITLSSRDLHTVRVPADTVAAWFVVEGALDPDHRPVCYTNHPRFDPHGMYEPMSASTAQALIETVLSSR